jgi:hypothetical protein
MVRVLAASVGLAAAGDGVTMLQSVSRMGDQLQMGGGVGVGTAQLDATNRMVDTLTSIAKDPDVMARLPSDIVEAFANQSAAIEQAIYDENANNQVEMDAAVQAMATCNTNMQNGFTADAGVDELNAVVYGSRNEHAGCRGLEDDHVTLWQSLCDDAQDKSNAFYSAEPDCLGSTAEYIDKDEYLTCTTATGVWYEAHYSGFSAAVTKCDNQYDVKESYHGWCDNNQTHFETAYVAYATRLSDTCTTFDTCYTSALGHHTELTSNMTGKETSQKELYKAVSKLNCLIAIFETATSENLIAGAVESCVNAAVDTSHLDITYDAVPSPEPCDVTTATWNATEYSNLNASHLEPIDSMVPQ